MRNFYSKDINKMGNQRFVTIIKNDFFTFLIRKFKIGTIDGNWLEYVKHDRIKNRVITFIKES